MENESKRDDPPSTEQDVVDKSEQNGTSPPEPKIKENVTRSDKPVRSDEFMPYVTRGKTTDSVELLTAAKKEDFVSANKILAASKDLDLDTTDEVGKTVLHYLSNFARTDEIAQCLNRTCDVNKTDKLGWTALHYAALKGHGAVAQTLINHGANCNAADKQQGRTPLHYAVSRDNRGVVDLLLESGADPNTKDNHNKTPLDICKNEIMKSTLETAAQKFEEEKTGAVSETLNILMDKPTPFSQLCLTVEPKSTPASTAKTGDKEMPFKMSMRRMSPANCNIKFDISETEDICSDVFSYKLVGTTPESLYMEFNIPVSCEPEKNEEMVLRTETDQEIIAHDVKEDCEKWFCSVTADILTFHSFVVVCRTITERFHVGPNACKIKSALDDRVELDIPKGTFDSNVTLTMEIQEPPHQDRLASVLKECPEVNSLTSFYSLESGGSKLLKPINIKVPQSINYQGSDNLLILSMDDSIEKEKPESWKVLSRGPKLKNERVEFAIESFSIKVAVETASTITDDVEFDMERSLSVLSQISRVFRKARRKEYQVLFICLTRRLGTTNTFKVVVECCKETQLNARLAYWEAEGYERQDADSKESPITVRAKTRFDIVRKSMELLDRKGDIDIEFHPKLDNQETFIVKLEENKQMSMGTIEIWKADQHSSSEPDQSTDKLKTKAFTFILKFVKFDPRSQSQDKSFISYERVMALLETIGDSWWKVLILMGVPFSAMEKIMQNNPGNVEEKVNAMFFDWREKHMDERSRGLPVLLAALCKSGMRGVATDLQIQLRNWKNDPENKADSFKEWLLMAYKFDLLMPTVYEKPMSDGFLAMLADQIEPNMEFSSTLNLPEGIIRDILAKINVYPAKGLRTMKMLDMFRVGIPDKQGALVALAGAMTKARMSRQHHYLIMATTAWLRKASMGDPVAKDTERFLEQVAANGV